MHSAIVAAIGTLKGPLHGGANEQVMRTLESIPADGVAQAVRDKLASGEKIMGFGHRVYKTEDPRATHLRKMSRELAEASGDDTYYRMSKEMEEVVFAEKGCTRTSTSTPRRSTTTSAFRRTCSPRSSPSAGCPAGPPT